MASQYIAKNKQESDSVFDEFKIKDRVEQTEYIQEQNLQNLKNFIKGLEVYNEENDIDLSEALALAKQTVQQKQETLFQEYKEYLINHYGIEGEDISWDEIMNFIYLNGSAHGNPNLISPPIPDEYCSITHLWMDEFMSYLAENIDDLNRSSFRYDGIFFSNQAHFTEFDLSLEDQCLSICNGVNALGQSFPFKSVTIGYKLPENQQLWPDIISSVVQLMEQASLQGLEELELINMDNRLPDYDPEFNRQLVEALTQAAMSSSELTCGIKMRDYHTNELIDFQNVIKSNLRAKGKQHSPVILEQVKSVSSTSDAPIRACKRDIEKMVSQLSTGMQMEQQQEQQQQQQQQQEQNLDDILAKKAGLAGFGEDADENLFYTRQKIEDDQTYSRALDAFDTLVGTDEPDNFKPIIHGVSKSVLNFLKNYPGCFYDGLNLHKLPPGFILRKSQQNENHYLLDYDPHAAKFDLRAQNDLSLQLKKNPKVKEKFMGDHRQFEDLSEEEFNITKGRANFNSIKFSSRLNVLNNTLQQANEQHQPRLHEIHQLLTELNLDNIERYVDKKKVDKLLEYYDYCIQYGNKRQLKQLKIDLTQAKDLQASNQSIIDKLEQSTPSDETIQRNMRFVTETTELNYIQQCFIKLLKGEDKQIGELIEEEYSKVLNVLLGSGMKSGGNKYLALLVQDVGAYKVLEVLQKLETIRTAKYLGEPVYSEQLFEQFIESFITKPAQVGLIHQDDYLEALDFLAELSPQEIQFIIMLQNQHLSALSLSGYRDGVLSLPELVNAFKEFKAQLAEVDPSLKIDHRMAQIKCDNLKIGLERLLLILNNSVDKNEQLDQVVGLDLQQIGPYYAKLHANYWLVTPEMQLTHDNAKSELNPDRAAFDVEYQDFSHAMDVNIDFEHCKVQFFRLMGKQLYREKFEHYKKIAEYFDEQIRIDPIHEPHVRVAFAFIAASYTNRKSIGKFSLEDIESIYSNVKGIPEVSFILKFLDIEINAPALEQLKPILLALSELPEDSEFRNISEDTKELFQKAKDSFYFSIEQSYYAKQKLSDNQAISVETLLSGFKVITSHDNLEDEDVLRNQIIKILPFIHQEGFSLETLEQFINFVVDKNNSNPDTLFATLDSISRIDLHNEKTQQLPKLQDIIHCVNHAIDSSISPSQLDNQIVLLPGFTSLALKPKSIKELVLGEGTDFINEYGAVLEQLLDAFGVTYQAEDLENFTKINALIDENQEKLKNPSFAIRTAMAAMLPRATSEAFKSISGGLHALCVEKFEEQPGLELYTILKNRWNLDTFIVGNKGAYEFLKSTIALESQVGELKKLVNTLYDVKKINPNAFSSFENAMYQSPGLSIIPIDNIVESITLAKAQDKQSKKISLQVLESLIQHDSWQDKPLKYQVDEIFNVANQLIAQKELDQDTSINLMNTYIKLRVQGHPHVLSEKFIETLSNNSSWVEPCLEILTRKPDMLRNLSNFINNENLELEIKTEFLEKFTKQPLILNNLLTELFKEQIPQDNLNTICTILIRLQNISEDNVNALCENLMDSDPETIVKLNKLIQIDSDIPFPTVENVNKYLSDETSFDILHSQLIQEKQHQREQLVESQFDASEVNRVINGIIDLNTNQPINYVQSLKLKNDFDFMNSIGYQTPISIDPKDPNAQKLVIKDMTGQQIKNLIQYHQNVVRSPESAEALKNESRLIYLAIIREVMYRTRDPIFPWSTQMLSILNCMRMGNNSISGILTGQGKSIIAAMNAAMIHLEGQTVDICTSNMQLAAEGFEEHQKFFEYLGVEPKLIKANSELDEYQPNGIYYSDVAQLALFRARASIESEESLEHKSSLILDEADFTLLDDSTQYRYAVNLDDIGDPFYNPFAWVYDLVNEFIESQAFLDANASWKDDIKNLRQFLESQTTPLQKRLIDQIDDRQLDTWIDSAVAAKFLYENTENKKWVLMQEERQGEMISKVKLMDNNRITESTWNKGVQQFIHTRVNKDIQDGKRITKEGEKPPLCPRDPETTAIAAITSKNFIDHYNKNGGVVRGMTGTPGSFDELEEQRNKFGFVASSIPSHQLQKRVDKNITLVDTNKQKQQEVYQRIIKKLRTKDKQPIVIVCADPIEAQAMAEYVKEKMLKENSTKHMGDLNLQLFNGIPEQSKHYKINAKKVTFEQSLSTDKATESEVKDRAGLQGSITITTPMMGRGTDFNPQKFIEDVNEYTKHEEGLYVLNPYLDIERTERQAIGRAGRKGALGESKIIVSREELAKYLPTGYKITQSNLHETIALIRKNWNLSSKQERALNDNYGDIKNLLFEQVVIMLGKAKTVNQQQWLDYEQKLREYQQAVEAYDEESQEPEPQEPPEPLSLKEQNKQILIAWEHLQDKLDDKSSKVISANVEINPDNSALIIGSYANVYWQEFANQFKQIDPDAKNFSPKQAYKLQRQALAQDSRVEYSKALDKDKKTQAQLTDAFTNLHELIQHDKIFQQRVSKRKTNSSSLLAALKSLFKYQKSSKNSLYLAKYKKSLSDIDHILNSSQFKHDTNEQDIIQYQTAIYAAHTEYLDWLKGQDSIEALKFAKEMEDNTLHDLYPKHLVKKLDQPAKPYNAAWDVEIHNYRYNPRRSKDKKRLVVEMRHLLEQTNDLQDILNILDTYDSKVKSKSSSFHSLIDNVLVNLVMLSNEEDALILNQHLKKRFSDISNTTTRKELTALDLHKIALYQEMIRLLEIKSVPRSERQLPEDSEIETLNIPKDMQSRQPIEQQEFSEIESTNMPASQKQASRKWAKGLMRQRSLTEKPISDLDHIELNLSVNVPDAEQASKKSSSGMQAAEHHSTELEDSPDTNMMKANDTKQEVIDFDGFINHVQDDMQHKDWLYQKVNETHHKFVKKSDDKTDILIEQNLNDISIIGQNNALDTMVEVAEQFGQHIPDNSELVYDFEAESEDIAIELCSELLKQKVRFDQIENITIQDKLVSSRQREAILQIANEKLQMNVQSSMKSKL